MCSHQMLVIIFPLMSTSKIRLLFMLQLDPCLSVNDNGMGNFVCRNVLRLNNSTVFPDLSQGKMLKQPPVCFYHPCFPLC